ncbi:MAG TPA: serine/threonine-protein kinase [Ktedonobacteraceae bacterium]
MEEEQAALSAGTLIRGRYLVKNVLGAGSTGAVYLVKDQKGQEGWPSLLALKEISGLAQQTRYNFVIDGTRLLQLSHPALPRIQALFNDEKRGCVYLVMEYIEGERLVDVQWSHLSRSELRAWCEPFMAALSYLHRQEQPLFHGDLKPANLVRTTSGRVVLLDLGYVPRAGVGRKSDCYRAPEQFSGLLDERSDVYGCGALLYTLLSGEEPADALTRRTRVGKKKTDPLVLASNISADVPREQAKVLQRALALDPAERFNSIREFWEVLRPLFAEPEQEQLLSPEHIPARSATPDDAVPTIPASGWGKRASGQSRVPVSRVSGLRAPNSRASHRWLLPTVAGAVALTLLLLSAATWALGAVSHNHSSASPTGTVASGSSVAQRPPLASATPAYPRVTGTFRGMFTPINALPVAARLVIDQQSGARFSGTFFSTLFSGKASGVVDPGGGLNWTLLDARNNAMLYFSGGLNGIGATQINTPDNMAGSFYKCSPQPGPRCNQPDGTETGGFWSLSFVPAT